MRYKEPVSIVNNVRGDNVPEKFQGTLFFWYIIIKFMFYKSRVIKEADLINLFRTCIS